MIYYFEDIESETQRTFEYTFITSPGTLEPILKRIFNDVKDIISSYNESEDLLVTFESEHLKISVSVKVDCISHPFPYDTIKEMFLKLLENNSSKESRCVITFAHECNEA